MIYWGFRLAYCSNFRFTFAPYKGQGEGHAHLDCEYLAKTVRSIGQNITTAITYGKSCIGFRLACLRLAVADSKGQDQGRTHFDCKYHRNY